MQASIRFFCLFLAICCASLGPQRAAAQATLTSDDFFQRGNEAFLEGDLRSAADFYTEALALEPAHASARFNRGVAYFKRNQWSRASDDFDLYLRDHKDDPEANAYRGQTAYQLQNFSEAVHYYSKALETPGNDSLRIDRGLAHFATHNLEAALQDFREAARVAPANIEAWLGYGNTLREMGDPANALPCYEKAYDLRPADPRPIFNMGIALFNLNKYEEAIERFDQTLRLNSRYAKALAHRAGCFFYLDRFAEAAADAHRALNLAPNLPEAYHVIGLLEINDGHLELAERIFSEALEFSPDNSELLAGRALARQKLRKFEDAREDADAAIAYRPSNGEAYFIRASVRKATQDDLGACADYQKANTYGYRPFADMDGTVFCEGLSDSLEAKKDGREHLCVDRVTRRSGRRATTRPPGPPPQRPVGR